MAEDIQSGPLNESAMLRSRYALKDPEGQRLKVKISLDDFSVHPQNRGGLFPSAARVVNLLCGILKDRFLKIEAQHEAVVVQELPAMKKAEYERLHGKPYKTHADHNTQNTDSVEALRLAYTSLSTYNYGALSHCTLTLGLMCLKHGAVWAIPEEHKGYGLEEFQTGPGGSWDIAKMRRTPKFSELMDVLDNGLLCEVLSWEIHFEAAFSQGPALISSALNDPQGKGVTSHEIELLASVADLVATAAAEAKKPAPGSDKGQPLNIPYDSILKACSQRHPEYAKATWFEDMFTFVINVGAASGPYIPQILDYDRRWVDHKIRTLSPATWGVLNQVPIECPHVKVALLMRAYSQEPKGGQCPAPEPAWGQSEGIRVQQLNSLLGYVRRILAPAAAEAEGEEKSATLTAGAVLTATEAFYQAYVRVKAGHPAVGAVVETVCEAVRPYYAQVREAWHKMEKNAEKDFPSPPAPWAAKLPAASENPDGPRSSGGHEGPRPQPVLIEFNEEDKPLNKQMSELSKPLNCLMVVPVKSWHASAPSANLDTERWHQASIAEVMTAFHRHADTSAQPLQMQYDVQARSVHVVATEDIAEGALMLFPCCPTAKVFPKVTSNPRAVEVQVGEKRPTPVEQMETYWALPDFKLPELELKPARKGAASAAAEGARGEAPGGKELDGAAPAAAEGARGEAPGGTKLVGAAPAAAGGAQGEAEEEENPYHFKFGGAESLHFFWGVDRMTAEELARAQLVQGQENWKFNVALRPQEFATMTKCAASAPIRVCSVLVPCMHNTVPLVRGDRLMLQITKEKKAPNPKKQVQPWQKEQKEKEKKRKKDAEEGRKAPKSGKMTIPGQGALVV